MSTEDRIRAELSRLVADLVHGRLAQLEKDGRIGRLTAADVVRGLEEYPGKLTVPAPGAYTELDIIEIKGSHGKKFALDFALWVDGEPSDLTLSCGVTVLDSGDLKLEMDDVHVL
jgi:hypothetical protein